jgi:sec-independent protein translocase protein TatB
MFDIGFWELSLIGIVALLVIGPEKLPGVAKTVGNFVGKAQRYVQNVKSDIKREFDADDLMRMMEDQKKTIERLETNIQESTNIIAKETQQIAQSIDDGDKEGDGISYEDILKLNKERKQKQEETK